MAAAFGIMLFFLFIGFAIVILITVLYLLNLQNTVKAAAPENRKLAPGNVWIMIIPLVGTIYSFIAVRKISETIAAEYKSKGQVPDNPKPTLMTGMSMTICRAVSWFISFFTLGDTIATYQASMAGDMEQLVSLSARQSGTLSFLSTMLGVAWLVLFIVYWVQTAGYKNKMKSLPSNNADSQIFGAY